MNYYEELQKEYACTYAIQYYDESESDLNRELDYHYIYLNAKSIEDAAKKVMLEINKHEAKEKKLKRNKGLEVTALFLSLSNSKNYRIEESIEEEQKEYLIGC